MQTKVLEDMKDSELKVYVVWTPVLREDDRQAAAEAVKEISDERATHFWDADKSLGLSLGKTVTLPRGRKLAWDVYFAFSADAQWHDNPPAAAVWMHQLGVDDKTLDGDKLRGVVEELVTSVQ